MKTYKTTFFEVDEYFSGNKIKMLRLWVFMAIGVAVILFLFVGSYYGAKTSCFAKAEVMSVEADWGFWSGCMADMGNGRMVPLNQYRVVD